MGAEYLIRRTDQGRCTRKKRRYLPSDLRPAFGSTCGETRSRWRPRNPGQQSNWGFRHPQVSRTRDVFNEALTGIGLAPVSHRRGARHLLEEHFAG